MTAHPTGTVTFLFTDIENSTMLALEHPETWEAAKSRHHAILRAAIEHNNGFVFQIIGDAFCAAFHKAADALKTSIQAQQDLQNEPRADFTLYVRMGIHTGEAENEGDEYRGYTTLSFVQRLMSAGHGGQILVSNTTENLLREQLPAAVSLRDMGMQKFAGVPAPARIFQVIAPELPVEFPPLCTLDNLPNNLPIQLTSFVGRKKELADVKRLLHNTHILTLIGPGGTGKTRLSTAAASEVLDQYPDGVWFVELAPILDPLLVPRTTGIAIGLRDEPQRPVIDMLCDYLREKKILLILDNCEHLVDACARMADRILHAAPDTRILASSREGLGIAGEVTYRVPSLGLPDLSHLPAVGSLSQYEAVKLFIDRATAAVPTFTVTNANAPALAQVCHQLDGIPLAIELAAAKVHVLSVEQIAKRLGDRFRLLTGGSRTALERHQTLRAAIDWSYNLLSPAEQVLFRRLSVFVGGWTLEASESIGRGGVVKNDNVLNLIEQLINKSLVFMEEEHGDSRYHMLETIHQYAHEKLLMSGESDEIRGRHLDYYLQVAKQAETEYFGPKALSWWTWLDNEINNLRATIAWSMEHRPDAGLKLINCLDNFLLELWFEREVGFWLSQLIPHIGNSARTGERAKGLLLWAMCTINTNEDFSVVHSRIEESISIYEEIGNKQGLAYCFHLLGGHLLWSGLESERQTGSLLLEKALALFRETKDKLGIATTLFTVGFSSQDVEFKLASFQEYLSICRELGDISGRIEALKQLGAIETRQGNFKAAHILLDEAFSLLQEHASSLRSSKTVSYDLGDLAFHEGNYELAQKYYEDCLAWSREKGVQYQIDWAKFRLGYVFLRSNRLKNSFLFFRETLLSFETMENTIGIIFTIDGLASLATKQCRYDNAVHLFAWTDAIRQKMNANRPPVEQASVERDLAVIHVKLSEADFAKFWEDGRVMTVDQAIALALEPGKAIKLPAVTENTILETLPSQREVEKQKYGGLTARERDVAAQIAQGKSNQAIAAELFVGLKTVDAHVTRILSKLGFTSRAQIAAWAVAKGLGEAPRDLDALGRED